MELRAGIYHGLLGHYQKVAAEARVITFEPLDASRHVDPLTNPDSPG